MGKQGRGRRLTDKERMEIIVITRENPRIKHVELAAKYGVNESTIRKWRGQTNASRIEERYTHGVAASRDQRQRGQAVRNAQFDGELYEWVVAMLKQDPDLPPVRIREKARALASLHEGMEGFKASSGWFYRFCRRYGLTFGATERALREKLFAGGSLTTSSDAVATVDSSTITVDASDGARDELAASTAMGEDPSPAAIAASLQPPAVPTTQLDGVDQTDQVNASNGMLLTLGDFSSTSNSTGMSTVIFSSSNVTMADGEAASATSGADASATGEQSSSSTPQVLTTTQVAVSHVLQHFKDLLDPPTRLRLVRHLSSVPGEAEMYLVMDDETRIEYIKEFLANNSSTV